VCRLVRDDPLPKEPRSSASHRTGGRGCFGTHHPRLPSRAVFADFDADVADRPHVRYAGSYRNPADLAAIYGEVHFSWAIDYYESGENSAWLLSNPVAISGVETGRRLSERGAGVVCDEIELLACLQNLDSAHYRDLATRVDGLPRGDLVFTGADSRDLVRAMSRAIP
jgi:succinoglycan biosynthesis protein ExoL